MFENKPEEYKLLYIGTKPQIRLLQKLEASTFCIQTITD